MTELRKIEPMELPATERAIVAGKKPELRWVDPTSLLVDETYQRELSKKSLDLIRNIVANFRWSMMKPPIVTPVSRGLHVIDGQHTAIAAATLKIESMPVFVVTAEQIVERAESFVSHNRNRIAISALQIHRALLASGEETAVELQKICDKVGVTFRPLSRSSAINVGDTQAVTTIRRMIERHGTMRTRQVLTACVLGKRAPIGESEMLAAFDIVRSSKGDPVEALSRAIRIEGDEGVLRAKAQASMQKIPSWRCLAEIYRKRMNGKAK